MKGPRSQIRDERCCPTWYSVTGRGRTATFTGRGRGGRPVVVLVLLLLLLELLEMVMVINPSVHLIVTKLMVLIVTNMVPVVLVAKLPAVLWRNVVYGLTVRANILNFSDCLGGRGHLEHWNNESQLSTKTVQ